MKEETIRSFIAIELGEKIREKIAQIEEQLKGNSQADVKWVKKENLHLTLKFLGNVSLLGLNDIYKEMSAVTQQSPFEIDFKELSAFPNLKAPRVIWLGVDKGREEVKKLSSLIEEGLSKLGFEREGKEFRAHLTLGRVRSAKNKDRLVESLEKVKIEDFSPIWVEKITLMESTLTREGPIYTPLRHFTLL